MAPRKSACLQRYVRLSVGEVHLVRINASLAGTFERVGIGNDYFLFQTLIQLAGALVAVF